MHVLTVSFQIQGIKRARDRHGYPYLEEFLSTIRSPLESSGCEIDVSKAGHRLELRERC